MNIADVLKESGAIKFGDFILASGKKSRYYIDIKKASTNPKILKMMACQISEMMKLHSISADYIAGVPIAVAVSLETGIPFVMIRKEVKEYGTKGQIVGDPERGKSAVLVEDVTTSGDSVLKALKILRDEGLEVRHVVVVVDREEGALKALAHADVEFIPLIRISELYNDL